jgi:hypothetical protein
VRDQSDPTVYSLPATRSRTAFPAQGVFSLFSAARADRDLDCIAGSNPRHFESLDHQATVRGLVEIAYFIVINQQVFPNEFLLLEPKIRHNSPFAFAQENNFFYLRLVPFHTSSSVAIQLASFTVGHC